MLVYVVKNVDGEPMAVTTGPVKGYDCEAHILCATKQQFDEVEPKIWDIRRSLNLSAAELSALGSTRKDLEDRLSSHFGAQISRPSVPATFDAQPESMPDQTRDSLHTPVFVAHYPVYGTFDVNNGVVTLGVFTNGPAAKEALKGTEGSYKEPEEFEIIPGTRESVAAYLLEKKLKAEGRAPVAGVLKDIGLIPR
ncbi:MAG TPA: hypothetical protein VL625_11925 [Patescibacteria group bacterium]|nr:hypothetical protein [Patescibacteria group bacterium]